MLIMKKKLYQVLPDEVDVIFKVEEQFSGSIGGSRLVMEHMDLI